MLTGEDVRVRGQKRRMREEMTLTLTLTLTLTVWVSAVRLHGLAQRLRLAPEVIATRSWTTKERVGISTSMPPCMALYGRAVWPGSSIRSTKTTRRRPRRVDPRASRLGTKHISAHGGSFAHEQQMKAQAAAGPL